MWVISALGPYLEVGSTASGGGRGAFSGASGRSSSTWPTARKKEFSWNTTNLLGQSKKYRLTNSETKSNAYHNSITNSEFNVISAREIEKLLN